MAIIRVGKPPRKAFNKKRPISDLLKNQIVHLEWATRSAEQNRKRRRAPAVHTEGQAAAYIAELTRQLHPDLEPPLAMPEPPVRRKAARPAKKRPAAKRASAKRPSTKRTRRASTKRTTRAARARRSR